MGTKKSRAGTLDTHIHSASWSIEIGVQLVLPCVSDYVQTETSG